MAATVPPDARVPAADPSHAARAILVEGVVQGVGFRPFVWRLAHALALTGWVRNDIAGVFLELEGEADALASFRRALDEAPPLQRSEEGAKVEISARSVSGSIEIERALEQVA